MGGKESKWKFEIIFRTNTHVAFRKVSYMSHGRNYFVIAAEKFFNCLYLLKIVFGLKKKNAHLIPYKHSKLSFYSARSLELLTKRKLFP